jgi:hypothetical protein
MFCLPSPMFSRFASSTDLSRFVRIGGAMSTLWDRDQKYLLREVAESVFHALNQPVANDSGIRKQTGDTAGADTFQLA